MSGWQQNCWTHLTIVTKDSFACLQRLGLQRVRVHWSFFGLPRRKSQAAGSVLMACFLILLTILQNSPSPAQAIGGRRLPMEPSSRPAESISGLIALQQQPFYSELLASVQAWDAYPIDTVVGETPKETILNFYTVMAKISKEQDRLLALAKHKQGWFWSKFEHDAIDRIEDLWDRALETLDLADVPELIRDELGHEVSLELKQILDYDFNNKYLPASIVDLQKAHGQSPHNARLHADGLIVLTNKIKGQSPTSEYYFSGKSATKINKIFESLGDKVDV